MKLVIDPKAYSIRFYKAEAFHKWENGARSAAQSLDSERTGQPLWQAECMFECPTAKTGDKVLVTVPSVTEPGFGYGDEVSFDGLVFDLYATKAGSLRVSATAETINTKTGGPVRKPAAT